MAHNCTNTEFAKVRPGKPYLITGLSTKEVHMLSKNHIDFMLNVYQVDEHSSYNQACTKKAWREAMNKGIQALENNNTWIVTNLPQGKRAIGSKCVYKVKYLPDGTVERYKARVVPKCYNQVE